jgi:signal transduction histidine kinase
LRVGLEYRLQGRDTAWASLGTSRSLALAALPSGVRNLEVRAVREGRPPGPPIALALDVRPPFFLSGWFGGLLLVVAVASWWGVSRVRSGRRQAAESVRQRIAEDLHDEVGSGLTQVALHSEMIRRLADGTAGDASASEVRSDIAALAVRVGEQANALSGSMRDLVWAIRPEERSWEDLELRLKDAAVATLAPHGIEADLRGEVDGAPSALPSEVCQNVLLFAKEALHNAVKHASPSRVEVRWKVSRRSITLQISDDGRGFDPATARRGVGLSSLRRRAEVLGGTFGLVAIPGEGARLMLDIPIGGASR